MRYISAMVLAITLMAATPVSWSQQEASQPSDTSSTPQATAPFVYPNTTDGLRQFLQDMRTVAKNGDNTKLSALIKGTEIPHYESWFTGTFGEEKGESWAGPYGKYLDENERKFQEFMMGVSQEDGEISVQRLDATKMYDTLTVPLDLFLAAWKKSVGPIDQPVDHIGYFVFIDGRFRWNSTVDFFKVQQSQSGLFVAGKLVKQVSPKYPPEALEKLIQGTVTLNVILRKMGRLQYRTSPTVTRFFPRQR